MTNTEKCQKDKLAEPSGGLRSIVGGTFGSPTKLIHI